MRVEIAATGVDAAQFACRRQDLHVFLHLRSAGRGAELDGLTQGVRQACGPELATVGAFAEFELAPGAGHGCALRTRPSEILVWVAGPEGMPPVPAAQALAVRCQALASGSRMLHAVDASHGHAAYALQGSAVRPLLQGLADDTALPRTPGSATRLRLADLHAVLAWQRDGSYLAIVDVLHADFLVERVAYAAGFVRPVA